MQGSRKFSQFFGQRASRLSHLATRKTALDRRDTRAWQQIHRHKFRKRAGGKRVRLGIDYWFREGTLYGLRLILKETGPSLAAELTALLGEPSGVTTERNGTEVRTWHDGDITFKVRRRGMRRSLVIQSLDLGGRADAAIAKVADLEHALTQAAHFSGGRRANLREVDNYLEQAFRVDPMSPKAKLLACRAAFNRGQYDHVVAHCLAAQQRTVSEEVKADAHYYQGLTSMVRGYTRSGVRYLKKAHRLGKRFARDTSTQARIRWQLITGDITVRSIGKSLKKGLFYMGCFDVRGWVRGRHFHREFGFATAKAMFRAVWMNTDLDAYGVQEVYKSGMRKCRP